LDLTLRCPLKDPIVGHHALHRRHQRRSQPNRTGPPSGRPSKSTHPAINRPSRPRIQSVLSGAFGGIFCKDPVSAVRRPAPIIAVDTAANKSGPC
jgi:hypothetical protein